MNRLVVLGCGWVDVLVAWRLKQAYPLADVVCIDRDTELGDLLKNIAINGYLFNISGSHVVSAVISPYFRTKGYNTTWWKVSSKKKKYICGFKENT